MARSAMAGADLIRRHHVSRDMEQTPLIRHNRLTLMYASREPRHADGETQLSSFSFRKGSTRRSVAGCVPKSPVRSQEGVHQVNRQLHLSVMSLAAAGLLLYTAAAEAYIGPGAGLSLLGAFWALIDRE